MGEQEERPLYRRLGEHDEERPLYRRMGEQLNSDEFSDCVFVVDNRKIPAHRILLAAASPVFRAMLSHRWQSDEILITDIQYDTFMDLLQYTYSDKLEIESASHACDLLYAFNKYMIEDASKICKKFIKTELSMDNCVQLYNFCTNIHEDGLSNEIVTYICEHIVIVVKQQVDVFDGSLWRSIFSAENVNMAEIDLIGHVYDWSLRVCQKERLKATCENVRRLLDREGIIKLIRILSLDGSALERACTMYGLFCKSEIDYIKMQLNEYEDKNASNENINLCTIREPRQPIPSALVHCMRLSRSNQLPLSVCKSENTHSVNIKSDRTIVLQAINIPTRIRPLHHITFRQHYLKSEYREDIKFTIRESDGNTDGECCVHIINETMEYDMMAVVNLPVPYTLKRNVWYTMTFEWEYFARNPNDSELVYYYYANSRCMCTNAVADIKYLDSNENSFLIGMRYSA